MGVKSIAIAAALAAGTSMLWAGSAVAADSTPAAAQEAQPRTPQIDGSRRVCRNLMLSGTRLTRRTCRTQTDWDADAEAARREHEDGNRNGSSQDAQNTEARPLGTPRL